MRINQLLFVGILGLVLSACGEPPVADGVLPSDTNVFLAENIDNRQIQLVWVELPSNLNLGDNEIRLFMARLHPPGMLVPTETELPCIIQSKNEYMDLRPVSIPIEFDGKQIMGSYTWNACASCIECYLDWETTIEIIAEVEQNKMDLSIGIRHMGHNIQGDFLHIELLQEKPDSNEPRVLCRRSFDCMDVEFVPRQ